MYSNYTRIISRLVIQLTNCSWVATRGLTRPTEGDTERDTQRDTERDKEKDRSGINQVRARMTAMCHPENVKANVIQKETEQKIKIENKRERKEG